MKTFLSILLLVCATPSLTASQERIEQSGWLLSVAVSPGPKQACSTELRLSKPAVLVNSGPSCGISVAQITERWLDSKLPPRTPNGGLVSEFRFQGWMENGKAKVAVWALVNDKAATFASAKGDKLTGQLMDTYLIEPDQSLQLNEFQKYGTKPVVLSVVKNR